ncbi:MAG: LacI family DNA-binding transcriptional regulator [Fimbriimonas sp.]|nr:LacI family DNA-binding transcriptional regulator [Fimbriimonas sp.]
MPDNVRMHIWDKQTHVTLKDVARLSGVSESAASVVMNGAKSGTRVSDSTKRRVLEAAEKLGYRPSMIARALVTGRTNVIGIYSGRSVLDSRNGFYAEFLGGVFDAAQRFGLNSMIHTSGSGEHYLLELLSSRSLDGLIVHPGNNDPILPLIGELRIPAVAVADKISDLPCVSVDDRAGGALLAKHLGARGHRHVLTKQTPYPPASSVERMESFKRTANLLGIRVTERLETFYDGAGLDYDDIRLLTEGDDRATAVAAWTDDVAEQVCGTLDAIGVEIPGQVAVVGFNGLAYPHLPKYQLTTIKAPWSEASSKAVEILIDLIAGKGAPMSTVLPIAFQRGNTT